MSWKCCQEVEIQSNLLQEGFSLLEGGKRRVLKRRPDSLCHRSWVVPVWSAWGTAEQPCTAVQVPAVVPSHRVAAGSALVWAKAAAGYFVHCRDGRGRQCALSKGNHICCVLSCMFLPALVGTCYCFMTAIKRVVRERLSRHKTEAKCLFGHYPSPLTAEIFPPTAASAG